MKNFLYSIILGIGILFLFHACGGDKFPLPEFSDDADSANTSSIGDTSYLQLRTVWDSNSGFGFDQPRDILVGREPLIYIADTGNDRILMLDLAGTILGVSQTIENPVAITQDRLLNLLVVTNNNKIYKIDLLNHNHKIDLAPVELVFEEVDNPDRRYTGIAPFAEVVQGQFKFQFFVSATGNQTKDNQVLVFPEDFDVRVPNAVNLVPNGFGILAAASPSGITTIRPLSQDFIFCMIGENSFKVQWIRPGEFGFVPRLDPAAGNIDIFAPNKFSKPEDVTIDEGGNIFVIDAGIVSSSSIVDGDSLYYLLKFSSTGKELQSFNSWLDSNNKRDHFKKPEGVAVFDKILYVADTGNNRIVRFKLSSDQ